LFLTNRGRGLKSNAEVDVLTVRDTALDTAREVCLCAKNLLSLTTDLLDPSIIMHMPRDLRTTESRSNLKRLGCRDRQHRMCKLCLQLVKAWLAQTCGHIPDHTVDSASNRVICLLGLNDPLSQLLGDLL